MTTTSPRADDVRSAQRGGDAVARRPEFEWLARAGLLARGSCTGSSGSSP
jgi:hypothetical protein